MAPGRVAQTAAGREHRAVDEAEKEDIVTPAQEDGQKKRERRERVDENGSVAAPRMPIRLALKLFVELRGTVWEAPASQKLDSLSFSLEMATRVVWTRTDGSSTNSSSGRASRAIQDKQC